MMKIDLERLYSKEEIAEVFRMSPKTIQREINLGRLRASRMANRQHMASGEALAEYFKSRENRKAKS
jgi:hypothetical protein